MAVPQDKGDSTQSSKPAKPAEADRLHKHGQIKPEDQKALTAQEKQNSKPSHDAMVQEQKLPQVQISDSKQKGFWANLVDQASDTLANTGKQINAAMTGAETALDQGMKKAGVPDDVRKNVNQGVHTFTQLATDRDGTIGHMVDGVEAAIDQKIKESGIADDVRKNVNKTIHTIRRIDEAEYKLAKGAAEGTVNLVGGLVHGAVGFAAEVQDKHEENVKKNPLLAVDPDSATEAALEVAGKKIVDALGAATQFGEKLYKDSEKEGGLDKLVSKHAKKMTDDAQKWVTETNIDNVGDKTQQVGHVIPGVAATVIGGLGAIKAVAKISEMTSAIRGGAAISEATGTVGGTTEVVHATQTAQGVAGAGEAIQASQATQATESIQAAAKVTEQAHPPVEAPLVKPCTPADAASNLDTLKAQGVHAKDGWQPGKGLGMSERIRGDAAEFFNQMEQEVKGEGWKHDSFLGRYSRKIGQLEETYSPKQGSYIIRDQNGRAEYRLFKNGREEFIDHEGARAEEVKSGRADEQARQKEQYEAEKKKQEAWEREPKSKSEQYNKTHGVKVEQGTAVKQGELELERSESGKSKLQMLKEKAKTLHPGEEMTVSDWLYVLKSQRTRFVHENALGLYDRLLQLSELPECKACKIKISDPADIGIGSESIVFPVEADPITGRPPAVFKITRPTDWSEMRDTTFGSQRYEGKVLGNIKKNNVAGMAFTYMQEQLNFAHVTDAQVDELVQMMRECGRSPVDLRRNQIGLDELGRPRLGDLTCSTSSSDGPLQGIEGHK